MSTQARFDGTSYGDCMSRKSGVSARSCDESGCRDSAGGAYVRPRFFAGQLLTEEDLQFLSDYVVAKNRLHNRHFLGEGVVCGLEVACHPCGGGKVRVAPGYGLDSCGNDIVLDCPTELDINAMVRELQIDRLGGYDCGDPCAEMKRGDGLESVKDGNEEIADSARRYCLYIRYCEDFTDPVTPYGTDEPCVSPGCEPTRIREGIRFELRCDECAEQSDNLFARIGQCLGDLIGLERVVLEGNWQRGQSDVAADADRQISAMSSIEFENEDLAIATENLVNSVANFNLARETQPEPPESVWQSALEAVLDAARQVLILVAGYLTNREREERIPKKRTRGKIQKREFANDSLELASNAVKQAYGAVATKIDKILPLTLERSYAHNLFKIGEAVFSEAAGPVNLPEIEVEFDTKSSLVPSLRDDQPVPDSTARLYLAYKVVVNPALVRDAVFSLEALREWLLKQIDKATWSTDCSLREDVLSIRLHSPKQMQQLQRSDVGCYYAAAKQLLDALLRYLRECLCQAFLPPCPSTDDSAVLLACLRVRDCEVVDICNLDRTFVLTPVAIRYWIPPLHWISDLAEQLCCQPIRWSCESAAGQGIPQRLGIPWSKAALLDRAKQMLAESVGLESADDRNRLAKILSAMGDLFCTEAPAVGLPKPSEPRPKVKQG